MSVNNIIKIGAVCSVLLCACASPTVVQSVKPGDNGLSCAQLQNEFADAERLRAAADAEKSVTGGNVARALLFWPAILGTAANANEAIAAADTRKVHITNLLNQKNCTSQMTSVNVNSNAPASAQATTLQQKKEVRLAELKKLHDTNLITSEVYAERQKAILDSASN